MISSGTLKTLYTLKDAGYEAYMVGGGVRDLLAGLEPKDFDVATNAHPEQVKPLFRSCRLVGRRFVICHVRFGDEIVETTTFRGAITDLHKRDETGRILSDNVYGTLAEDAIRRDFTVNALYYDIRDYSIVDFTTGIEDMRAGVIRLIGDPELRYREDPVRMLRAIRIANKLHFRIDDATAAPIARRGRTCSAAPSWSAAPGIPQTMLLARSCAKVRHPRSRSASMPRAPSAPMPVRSTAAPVQAGTSARLPNRTSTEGRCTSSGSPGS